MKNGYHVHTDAKPLIYTSTGLVTRNRLYRMDPASEQIARAGNSTQSPLRVLGHRQLQINRTIDGLNRTNGAIDRDDSGNERHRNNYGSTNTCTSTILLLSILTLLLLLLPLCTPILLNVRQYLK